MPNNPNTKLVDSKTIAAIFGVDPRRVQQLAKEGVITATKDGHANRYDLLPTIQKYIRYLSDKANGREPSKKDSEIEARRLDLAGLREQGLIMQNATGAARIALGQRHQYRQITQKPARERSRAGFFCFIGPCAASGQRRPLYRSSCPCSARRSRRRPDPPVTSSEPDLRQRQPRRPAGHHTQATGADR